MDQNLDNPGLNRGYDTISNFFLALQGGVWFSLLLENKYMILNVLILKDGNNVGSEIGSNTHIEHKVIVVLSDVCCCLRNIVATL